MTSTNPLEEFYVRTLHSKMFDQVWKWAGTYRTNKLNFGCDPAEIVQRIPQLLANTKYWLDHKTFPNRRMHDSIPSRHCFENPSVRKRKWPPRAYDYGCNRPETRAARVSWGAGENLVAEWRARRRLSGCAASARCE